MTAFEYMEKQAQKHRASYHKEFVRGASVEQLNNIRAKISYYEEAASALKKEKVK